jgi:predicted NAD/FAD-binding protein
MRFFANHGFLDVRRPRWRVVRGGSARYVERLTAPFRERCRLRTPVRRLVRDPESVTVHTDYGCDRYDHVVIAAHSDQALAMLAAPTTAEAEVLGAIPYQSNEAILHTDTRLLPRNPRALASWNYRMPADPDGPLCLTYDMNRLQRLDAPERFLVSLNAAELVDERREICRIRYTHPMFTPAAVRAQQR